MEHKSALVLFSDFHSKQYFEYFESAKKAKEFVDHGRSHYTLCARTLLYVERSKREETLANANANISANANANANVNVHKDSLKEEQKDVPKETPKDVPKEAPKETPKEAPKDISKEAPKETSKEASNETPKESTKDPLIANKPGEHSNGSICADCNNRHECYGVQNKGTLVIYSDKRGTRVFDFFKCDEQAKIFVDSLPKPYKTTPKIITHIDRINEHCTKCGFPLVDDAKKFGCWCMRKDVPDKTTPQVQAPRMRRMSRV